ncbi:anhydro-N-acetylmuramic acid kinase, partial [Gelidibacter sp.]|uniref:anhydro-N-acetylmuramic acid kinase n=1 Tax=Gelidibacter sp. TaxID=2018083 RepID=UPI0032651F75
MNKNHYNVIGVMSGTSLDGLDIAHCTFTCSEGWEFKILEAETCPYPSDWVEKLRNLVTFTKLELVQLDEEYTSFIGDAIR